MQLDLTSKFLVSPPLGKLARWLRIMGYNTQYFSDLSINECITYSQENNLIFIGKSKKVKQMAKKINLPFIIISTNTINQQLMELKEQGVQIPKLDITKSRCSLCNGEIISCNEQEVKELTPLGSQKQFHEFYYCNQCNQLYWEGSHWKRMRKTLKNL